MTEPTKPLRARIEAVSRKLKRAGFRLKKSRVREPHWDDQGGFMILSARENLVLHGGRFDLEIAEVEEIAAEIANAA